MTKAKTAMALSFEMTQAFFFTKQKPMLDPLLPLSTVSHIVGLMESAVDFRQQFTVTMISAASSFRGEPYLQ